VDIDAQAACDSDTWSMGVRRLAVANGPNIFQMLLVAKIYVSNNHRFIFAADGKRHRAKLARGPWVRTSHATTKVICDNFHQSDGNVLKYNGYWLIESW